MPHDASPQPAVSWPPTPQLVAYAGRQPGRLVSRQPARASTAGKRHQVVLRRCLTRRIGPARLRGNPDGSTRHLQHSWPTVRATSRASPIAHVGDPNHGPPPVKACRARCGCHVTRSQRLRRICLHTVQPNSDAELAEGTHQELADHLAACSVVASIASARACARDRHTIADPFLDNPTPRRSG